MERNSPLANSHGGQPTPEAMAQAHDQAMTFRLINFAESKAGVFVAAETAILACEII